MRKILFLQATSEIGGTDITLLRTIENLDRTKFEAQVVFPKEGPLAGAFEKAGCKIHYLPAMRQLSSRRGGLYLLQYAIGFFPAVIQLWQIILREKIDLIHTNTIHNFYGFLAARLSARPHVWHDREIVVQSRLIKSIERYLVPNFSTRFIVMSDAIGEMFLENGALPAHCVKLYDGIPLERFGPGISGQRIRRELGIASTVPLAGMVCRLDPWKGIDLFLEAAAQVHREKPETRFLVCGGEIAGHEGYEAVLKKKALELGIQDAVYFSGWKYRADDIPEVYAALNISVQSPVSPEPYGLACLEAMASGVPIVAPREGGPAELCEDGVTALLVTPRNSKEIASAVLELLQNPQKAKKMGEAGRARAAVHFDVRRCVRRLEAVYENILNGAPLS